MINNRQKNKIRTPGYFIKRLRDNKYGVIRMFQDYGEHDPRRWTVMIDPGRSSVLITCYTNKEFNNDIMFEFNDGGAVFPKNYSIKTESIEVIVQELIKRNIQPISTDSEFFVDVSKNTASITPKA